MRAIFIALVIFFVLSSITYAGLLTASRVEGPDGTTFTVFWGQGCPTGTLGPNQCYSDNQPFWCPLSSRGNTALVKNSSACNCPSNERRHPNGIDCIACPDPCDSCPSDTTCTSPTTDWCTTVPICDPIVVPCPYFCAPSYSECSNLGGRSRSGYYCGGGERCCELPGSPPPSEPPPPGSSGDRKSTRLNSSHT